MIHFAALKAVGESVKEPVVYYHNNVMGTINLVEVSKEPVVYYHNNVMGTIDLVEVNVFVPRRYIYLTSMILFD